VTSEDRSEAEARSVAGASESAAAELAEQRAAARVARDFAEADRLRDEIAALGWLVKDTPDGFELSEKPPYEVLASVAALPDRPAEPSARPASVQLVVEGWPDDLTQCLDALLAHTSLPIVGLDLGNVDGAGDVLHSYAAAHPDRVEELHVAGAAGWSAARTALLKADPSEVVVWLETSTVLDGDALSPLLAVLASDTSVVGAGWRGVDVDVADEWRTFVDHEGAGECDALLGYLAAWDRAALLAVGGPHPKARFYRNADMELSLMLREQGGRLMAVPDLPCHQERHRGYHDSDPGFRDAESRKTYDRILHRFRGNTAILAPRP
jgi:GT2 family glycosyltransferase